MNTKDHGDEELSRTAHEWRERISRVDVTESEREELEAWLNKHISHEEAFHRACTIWAAYDHLRRDDIDADLMPRTTPALPIGFLARMVTSVGNAPRLIGASIATMAVFAALLGFVTLRDSHAPPEIVGYETGIGETRVILLGDGSLATLGAHTQIKTAMSEKNRTVTLVSGAALFQVNHDKARPFSVVAGAITARALGTEFDVRSSGGMYRVAVVEGRVEVVFENDTLSSPKGSTARRTLRPGEQIAASRAGGLLDVRSVDTADIAAWRSNKLIYDGGTLGELLADANRYSEQRIVLDVSAQKYVNRSLTASFDADNVERMLVMLTRTYPIEIDETEPGVKRLRARGNTNR